MRLYTDCKRLYGCQKETCIAIGYCGEGSFQLPAGQKPDKANLRKQWCQALGIGRKDILAGEKELRIAYWHFPEERFRHFDEKVSAWKLKPTAKWVDNEKQEWLGAVPIRNLDEFVSSYLSARHEPTFGLPAVVSTVQKPRQITFSPSSSGRILYAPNSTMPKSTVLIKLESAYKVLDIELAVANKCILDTQKKNSSLKQELENTQFRLEKV
jgi:hypothetical protein